LASLFALKYANKLAKNSLNFFLFVEFLVNLLVQRSQQTKKGFYGSA